MMVDQRVYRCHRCPAEVEIPMSTEGNPLTPTGWVQVQVDGVPMRNLWLCPNDGRALNRFLNSSGSG